MEDKGPSLPSNYVTILHLKERWLQQKQQEKSSNHHGESDSQSSRKPEDDSAFKVSNEAVVSTRNRPRGVYQVPEVRLRDSGSKSVVQVADEHPMVEKQVRNTGKSNSRLSTTKNSSAGRNPRLVINQNQTGGSSVQVLETEPVQEKKQKPFKGGRRRKGTRNQNLDELSHNDSGGDDIVQAAKEITVSNESKVSDDHPVIEKQVRNTDQSNSRLSMTKNSSTGRNPRFVINQNQIGGSSVPLLDTESVQEKKQTLYVGGRQYWKQNQNTDELAHNDSGGDEIVEAVKEINVSSASNRSNRRFGSGKFNGVQTNRPSKPPVGKTLAVAQNVNGSSQNGSGGVYVVEAVKEISVSSVSNGSSRRSGSGRFNGAAEPVVGKTPPAPNVNGSSHNDSVGDGVVEAVVAAVKEINVSGASQGTNRRWSSGRIYGNGHSKRSFGVKKGQTATVWVKKGESAPN